MELPAKTNRMTATGREHPRPRVLLLFGGWEGHHPAVFAELATTELLTEFEVTTSGDLGMLRPEVLRDYDLLLPIWTFGELNDDQVAALLDAVANGLGMVAWHGATSSFLNSRSHKFLLGGQFVGHPGGEQVSYDIHFVGDDPLVMGLADFTVTSEQYYLLIDPAVHVLATTHIDGAEFPWLAGVEMPIAWRREWGLGKVFYCALGHTPDLLRQPDVHTLLRRAIRWAVRKPKLDQPSADQGEMLR